jgi:hypothetical protein
MTPSDDPLLSSGLSPSPTDAAPENVTILTLPPHLETQQTATEHRAAASIRLLEAILAFGVVTLGFLLALQPARNSDVWLLLASGRLLARGEYRIGVDPFS